MNPTIEPVHKDKDMCHVCQLENYPYNIKDRHLKLSAMSSHNKDKQSTKNDENNLLWTLHQ